MIPGHSEVPTWGPWGPEVGPSELETSVARPSGYLARHSIKRKLVPISIQ